MKKGTLSAIAGAASMLAILIVTANVSAVREQNLEEYECCILNFEDRTIR